MKLLIIFIGLFTVLKPLVSKLTSYLAENISSISRGSISSGNEESHSSSLWNSSFIDDSSIMSSSFMDSDESSTCDINPANGLPMIGCLDIEGNAYGTDSTHWDDTISIDNSSLFEDTFSTDSSSMFDDTFSSSSISSFDD